jgi:hypothetical protein
MVLADCPSFDRSAGQVCRGRPLQGIPARPRVAVGGLRGRLAGKNGAQAFHLFQRDAAASYHTGQRVFGHQHRQAGFFGQQTVQVTQQGATAGEHHAAVGNVGTQFGWRLFQCVFNSRDDVVDGVGQRFQNFIAGNGKTAWHALRQVAPAHFHLSDFTPRESRANILLDSFCRGFPNQHAVVTADVVDDGIVKTVTPYAHAALVNHAAKRNHADLGGSATNVDDHRSRCFGHGQTCTDGRCHGFLYQVHIAGAGTQGTFANGAPLYLGRTAGYTNDDARARPKDGARMNHLDKLLEHLLGDREIGNHPVFHGANGLNIARNLAQHGLGFLANGLNGLFALWATLVADGHHRRLIEHDALVAYVNQGIGGAKVDGQVS